MHAYVIVADKRRGDRIMGQFHDAVRDGEGLADWVWALERVLFVPEYHLRWKFDNEGGG